ncbi:MAG: hypothetical protein CR979_02465 [Propionibacterium sp.]|nr:MAG: hypothetical protein CR979_02465 [Propionibacterium sp.]
MSYLGSAESSADSRSSSGSSRPGVISGDRYSGANTNSNDSSSASGSKHNDLKVVISHVRRAIPELKGVMIASQDGLSIAHDFPENEAERIAAMAATALGLGKRISERTSMGDLAEAVIRGQNGYLVVYGAGTDAVLVMQGPIDSNLGLMRIESRVASVEIKQLLGRA